MPRILRPRRQPRKRPGYLLVYRVEDGNLLILVIAVGRREREAYRRARQRLSRPPSGE